MARGGISFEGIGFEGATFKAGSGLKGLVEAGNKNEVAGVPVVISGNGEVDLGTDKDTVFGFVDVYEDDGHCTVQFKGFRTDVPISQESLDNSTVKKIVAVNGLGQVKDSETTAKLRSPIFVEVDNEAKTATVFLG